MFRDRFIATRKEVNRMLSTTLCSKNLEPFPNLKIREFEAEGTLGREGSAVQEALRAILANIYARIRKRTRGCFGRALYVCLVF